jgi:hypothetical protein
MEARDIAAPNRNCAQPILQKSAQHFAPMMAQEMYAAYLKRQPHKDIAWTHHD